MVRKVIHLGHIAIKPNKRVKGLLFWVLVSSLVFVTFFGVLSCVSSTNGATTPETGKEITQYENGYRFDENGWIYVHIEGAPYERGFQHGYLVAPELKEILRSLKYLTYLDTGME